MSRVPGVFLRAEWRHLLMLNYEVQPEILRALVPAGTELDLLDGRCYASVVGFMFLRTRVLGVPIPFHRDFEEVNLRFYVRRRGPEGWRRGVVFIREMVPRWAIAAVARVLYGENYVALPMRHVIAEERVEYGWRSSGEWACLRGQPTGPLRELEPGSEAEFIAEHYWGYARTRSGGTVEYRVEHPRWLVRDAVDPQLNADVAALYGQAFAEPLGRTPRSAFIAEGSPIVVRHGERVR